jgi:hypothetical protein
MTEKSDFQLFTGLSSLETFKNARIIPNAQPTNGEGCFQKVLSKNRLSAHLSAFMQNMSGMRVVIQNLLGHS